MRPTLSPRALPLAVAWIATCVLTLPAAAGSTREIARELRVNQQQLQDFTWTSRAEIQVNGKVRHVELHEVRYDMDGGLLKTAVDERDGGSRRARRGPALDPAVGELADACAHLTLETLQQVFAEAALIPAAETDVLRVQAERVEALGDKVDLWVDRASRRPLRTAVATVIDGQEVRIETEFTELPGGAAAPARTTVHTRIKGRPAVIEIRNFDFVLAGG